MFLLELKHPNIIILEHIIRAENDKDIFDLMIKNAMVINGSENVSFLTDVAINFGSDNLL